MQTSGFADRIRTVAVVAVVAAVLVLGGFAVSAAAQDSGQAGAGGGSRVAMPAG